MEKEEKKSKIKKIILILIVILTAIILLLSLVRCNSKEVINPSFEVQQIDSNQTDEVEEELIYVPTSITLPGFTDLTIQANEKNVHLSASFYNPISNVYYTCPNCETLLDKFYCVNCKNTFKNEEAEKNQYFLKFELSLDDTGETIYSSNLVSAGYRIEDITLTRALEAGDYSATISLLPYANDMTTPCNIGVLNITLHVTDTI